MPANDYDDIQRRLGRGSSYDRACEFEDRMWENARVAGLTPPPLVPIRGEEESCRSDINVKRVVERPEQASIEKAEDRIDNGYSRSVPPESAPKSEAS